MPISRRPNQGEEQQAAAPRAASGGKRVLSLKDSSQLPSKRTLNLCMRERSNLTAEAFLVALSIVLIVVMVVEFFGVYQPYARVEALERDIAAAQSELDRKNDRISDFDDVRDFYNQYNYEGFPQEIADRLDVLELLETEIMTKPGFEAARIRSLSVRGNTIDLTIDGLTSDEIAQLYINLIANKLVDSVPISRTGFNGDGVPNATLQIVLKDATTVK